MECTMKGRVHKKAAMNIPDDSSQFFMFLKLKLLLKEQRVR